MRRDPESGRAPKLNAAERQTRTYLRELFEQQGIHPRTDLGQNFLIDLNLVELIVREADLSNDDVVLEVGAGTGGMTTLLARQAAAVISVEVDRSVHAFASRAVSHCSNVTLLRTDALKNKNRLSPEVVDAVCEQLALDPERRLKLVSNLPYSIATPVISNLVATDLPWTTMVVTIQYELGERMQAGPGSSHYGSLSVWLQSQCEVEMLRKLGPTVFWPRPQVNSAIMKITADPVGRSEIVDRPFFQDYVRRLFHQRRKFLRSVLVGMYRKQVDKPSVDAVLAELEFPENVRAEELPVARHVTLANRLYALVQQQAAT